MMKMKSFLVFLCLLVGVVNGYAQQVVDLWNGQPPTENGLTVAETVQNNGTWYINVSHPTLTIYSPQAEKNTGAVVVVCPGGGYAGLSFKNEGTDFAEWLNSVGITAVILKYRMPNKHKEIPLNDAWEAIRYVRRNAEQLHINPSKVGIAGFSAGGHLASTAATHFAFDGINTRPDFCILYYPVITMERATHGGSRANLLGDNPSPEDIHMFSNEKQVNVNTPPTILFLSDDDRVVLPQNSIDYYRALKNNNIPASMYIFPEGGHGFGMTKGFKYRAQKLALLEMWLKPWTTNE
ncbi:alpha/beta hydrolase [Parabacteroides sp. PF5-6]|uniref:alpha/beta hydrolase n=1 Tax=Parabacteroides sp. PF5-6 TaxID=1742403 RepID=UPI002406ECB3|nr:alpha/beta hydrolase [Parabacteroides sp. PF5-6]